MDFYICWSIDCESCRAEVNDIELGKRAIEGYCAVLEEVGWKGTLFLVPELIEQIAGLLLRKAEAGHELALHLHPDGSGYRSPFFGVYSYDEQVEIAASAIEKFETVLGARPVTVRTGYASANDNSFLAFKHLGLGQSSTSIPGRKMSNIVSNWAGAPVFAHYAHPYNRMLIGGLDLVEIPLSVDLESMIWGGIHPQDLRVEYTDAKNHGFVIRKLMNQQAAQEMPLRALLPFTHDKYDYSDPRNFRRQTMEGMVSEIVKHGAHLGVSLVGGTIAEAAAAFRNALPFQAVETPAECLLIPVVHGASSSAS
ncbi:MAG: polysaccharide deacetylase family protein [Armatimonadetes bacterium]|nr:polysaccharide deacetylase family protein [Armatimonadota bacterium]